jgi:hypothetical protein
LLCYKFANRVIGRLGLPITHKSCLSFFVFNVQAYFNNFEKTVKATTYTKAGAFRRRLG